MKSQEHVINAFHRPIVSVFDKKTGLFSNPFSVRHIGEAVREWDIVRKDTDTKIGKNPEDFDLRQIGYFDEQTGELFSMKPAQQIAAGV